MVKLASIGSVSFLAIQIAAAQPPAAPAQSPAATLASSGTYTLAQAERGNALFQNSCAVCHGGALQGEEDSPPLAGKEFNTNWGGKPVANLYNFIGSQMPLGQPGALGSQGNADVVAYILAMNKFPAGAKELPPDTNVLDTITIDKR